MKKIIIICSAILIVVLIAVAGYNITKKAPQEEKKNIQEGKLNTTDGIITTASLEDEVQNNTIWCGTFQLIWNDLKNEIAKKDIEFNPQSKIAEIFKSSLFTGLIFFFNPILSK